MQSVVISNLRASRLNLTSSLACVRTMSDSLSTMSEIKSNRKISSTESKENRTSTSKPFLENRNSSKPISSYSNIKYNKGLESIEPLLMADQEQLSNMTTSKIRAIIQYDSLTPECINLILRFIAAKQVPSSLIGLVEEKALNYLVLDDDDLISRYLKKTPEFDYDSLCELFVGLAGNRRRPTPLLRAAATHLCRLPPEKKADFTLILGALNSLISLNFPYKPLISRLVNDLGNSIDFDRLGNRAMCNLLGIIRSLRWRPDELISKIVDYQLSITDRDPTVIATLIHLVAYLDYPVDDSIKKIVNSFAESKFDEAIQKNPKLWLSYVWSTVALRLANRWHIDSVLTDRFIRSLSDPGEDPPITYSDAMKLLNLKVLAEREYEIDVDSGIMEKLASYKIQRSVEKQRYSQRVQDAILGIIGSKEKMLVDVETPFGFTIDIELAFDKNSQALPIDSSITLDTQGMHNNLRHCALILVSYEDTITNLRGEAVGYKKIISRILKSYGFTCILLPETILNREKSSADLTNCIKDYLSIAHPT